LGPLHFILSKLAEIMLLGSLGWALIYAPLLLGMVLLAAIILIISLSKPRVVLYMGFFFILADSLKLTLIYSIGTPIWYYKIVINPSTWFFLLALISWLMGRLTRLYPPLLHSNTVDLPMLIIGLSGWITLLWSPYLVDGITQQINCLQGLIIYFAITRLITTTKQVEAMSKFWFFLGLCMVAIFILSLFINFNPFPPDFEIIEGRLFLRPLNIPQYEGVRDTIVGISPGPKHLSSLITVAIPLSVAFLYNAKQIILRRFIQISIVLMLTLQVLTFSRVDLVASAGGWLAFVYLMPAWRKNFVRYQLFMITMFIIAFLTAFLLLSTFYPKGFEEFSVCYLFGSKYQTRGGTTAEAFGPGSVDIRMQRILAALESIWNTGGLGAGSGGILAGLEAAHKIDIGTMILGIFFEHGFGLLSYIFFAWLTLNVILEIRQGLHACRDKEYIVYLRSFCWILVSFGITAFLDFSNLYWPVIGMSMAAAQAVYISKPLSP
jgi:hypothetical protein